MPDSLQQRFESIRQHVDADPALIHRGRHLSATLKVFIGARGYLVEIRQGRITDIASPGPLFRSADLTVRAAEETWAAFWQQTPAPGWHDLFALTKRGALSIDGDSHLLFSHLQYLKDVLSLPGRAPAH